MAVRRFPAARIELERRLYLNGSVQKQQIAASHLHSSPPQKRKPKKGLEL